MVEPKSLGDWPSVVFVEKSVSKNGSATKGEEPVAHIVSGALPRPAAAWDDLNLFHEPVEISDTCLHFQIRG